MDSKPMQVKVKEKGSPYNDPGFLMSKLGLPDYEKEFAKVKNMGKNSKVWFFLNTQGTQFLGQAVRLNTGWKVTVFDRHVGETSMIPIATFVANDRLNLEELMYSLYFDVTEYAIGKGPNPEGDSSTEID